MTNAEAAEGVGTRRQELLPKDCCFHLLQKRSPALHVPQVVAFFRRSCVLEGDTAQSQVWSGNAGLPSVRCASVSVVSRIKKKGLRTLLPVGARDSFTKSASSGKSDD